MLKVIELIQSITKYAIIVILFQNKKQGGIRRYIMRLTKQETIAFFNQQKKIFDVVRLVDVSMTKAYLLQDDGEIKSEPYQCYAVWNKSQRCENCISAKAYAIKGKLSKFEFVNDDIYFVMSIYCVIDGTEYMIELVTRLDDNTLLGAYGKDSFIQTIQANNKRLYIDALTGAYNRNYYEEQLNKLRRYNIAVMIDADNFKAINDTYGHNTGDTVLKEIAVVMLSRIRNADAVVRLGGDEFLLLLQDINKDALAKKLDGIRQAVSDISIDGYPGLKVSVSIGAAYTDGGGNLLAFADEALYEAKKQKNEVVIKKIPN